MNEEIIKKPPKMIGIRKMVVIMWCVGAIAGVMLAYLNYDKALDAPALAGLTMIAGLGGVHTIRKKKNGTSN